MHLTRSMSTSAAWGIALALFLGPPPARSAGVEDFYKGKTVSLLIGYSVGGGYDAYGRLVARHLGKHIPGNPNVQPQNMTGAGSLKAANYVYSVAPNYVLIRRPPWCTLFISPLLDQS